MLEITIFTEPVAQERPRFTRVNGYPRAYEPVKSRHAKAEIQNQVRGILKQPFSNSIKLEVRFYRSLTKEMQQKKLKNKVNLPAYAYKRPDLDNYIKLLKDALNGVFWTDDSLIVELVAGKYYDEVPRIEIKLEEISDEVECKR